MVQIMAIWVPLRIALILPTVTAKSLFLEAYEPGFMLWFGECKYVFLGNDTSGLTSVCMVVSKKERHGSYGGGLPVRGWTDCVERSTDRRDLELPKLGYHSAGGA